MTLRAPSPDSPAKSPVQDEARVPPSETDVLIVGGGPVGSALAVDLRLRGIRCAIVERVDGIAYDMRAMNNDMRTMEYFRAWGIADAHRACSPLPREFQRDLVFCSALYGHELGVFRAYGFRAEDAAGLAAEAGQPLSQKFTNVVLRQRAKELGTSIATGWEFLGLTQTPEGVTAEVAPVDGGTAQRVRAAFVVGCDGGRSTVVRSAGITRSGAGAYGKHVHVVVRCPDLLAGVTISPGAFYIVFNARVGGLLLPSDVDEFNVHLAGFAPDEDTSGLDLESIAKAFLGRDCPVQIESVSPYLVHELVADTYRLGRVLIAGDAAHLFCPFGGFNMNTGIGDAGNLGWKLAAHIQGWGGDVLLDSYSEERRPIALANSAEATYNINALNGAVGEVLASGVPEDDTPEGAAGRSRIGERLYELTFREWNTAGVVLDQRYAHSRVVVDDGVDVPLWHPSQYVPTAKPGHRAPHVWLNEGLALYDRLGPGFTLLDLGAREKDVQILAQAAAVRTVPFASIRLDREDVRELYDAPLVLLRPDRHVAWRGHKAPRNPLELIDTVRGVASAASDVPPRQDEPELTVTGRGQRSR